MKVSIYKSDKNILDEDILNSSEDFVRKVIFLEECRDNKELLILRGHLAIEYFLNEIIKNFLPKGDKLIRKNDFSFSKKILIIDGFDTLEEDTLMFVKELNKIRNKCAHKISYRVSDTNIDNLVNLFPEEVINDIKDEDYNKTLLNLMSSALIDLSYNVCLLKKQKPQKPTK